MEFFYLWDTNAEIFDVFVTLLPYLTPEKQFDTNLILALREEKKLKLEDLLQKLPLLRSGYLSRITPAPEEQSNKLEGNNNE